MTEAGLLMEAATVRERIPLRIYDIPGSVEPMGLARTFDFHAGP